MPEPSYEVLSGKRTSPPRRRIGFYSDFTATNFGCCPVILVDMFNVQHVINPVSTLVSANGVLELVYRSEDVLRTDPIDRYATVEEPIAAKCIKIDLGRLDLGPIYVPELEVVVCLPEHSPAVIHPKSKVAYDYAVKTASVMLASNDTIPSLRIFANDPSGLVTEIFAYMFNTVVRCPVTKIDNREASITVVITSGRRVVYQKSYLMHEFLNKNKFVSDETSPILCFGTSRTMVEEYAKNKERGNGRLSEDDVKIIKAEAMIAARGENEATIRDLNNKLQDATNKNLEFQGRMQQLQIKMADQENQLSVLTSQINGYKAMFANHEQVAALSRSAMQTDIAREKTKQARISTNTEEIKKSEVIWKLAGGAAIALITAVVTAYLKDRK